MNTAVLHHFRDLADTMAGDQPRDWAWIGRHMSQRMYGITAERAKAYVARYGGAAITLEDCDAMDEELADKRRRRLAAKIEATR